MEGRKKGTKKKGKKGKEKRQKDTLRVGSVYDDDCHEYYALSRRCFNEIVLGVTMSSSS